jgi:serine/threonine-protein kinase RsbW
MNDESAQSSPGAEARAAAPGKEPLRAMLRVTSSPSYLSLLRAHTRWFCEQCGASDIEEHRVLLSVVEAFTNISRHAYDNAVGEVEIELRMLPERNLGRECLEITFLDRGRFVPLSECRGRSLDDLRPGGLGTHMLDSCMDEIQAEERLGGGRRLVLTKTFENSGSQEPSATLGTEVAAAGPGSPTVTTRGEESGDEA